MQAELKDATKLETPPDALALGYFPLRHAVETTSARRKRGEEPVQTARDVGRWGVSAGGARWARLASGALLCSGTSTAVGPMRGSRPASRDGAANGPAIRACLGSEMLSGGEDGADERWDPYSAVVELAGFSAAAYSRRRAAGPQVGMTA